MVHGQRVAMITSVVICNYLMQKHERMNEKFFISDEALWAASDMALYEPFLIELLTGLIYNSKSFHFQLEFSCTIYAVLTCAYDNNAVWVLQQKGDF
jgi:hypothetical protein